MEKLRQGVVNYWEEQLELQTSRLGSRAHSINCLAVILGLDMGWELTSGDRFKTRYECPESQRDSSSLPQNQEQKKILSSQ